MAKTSNSAKNQANALKRRCEGYADIVRRQFSAAANDLLDLARSASSIPSDQLFSFGKTKRMRDEADLIIRTLHAAVYEATKRGIILEWEEANKAIDAYLGTMIGRDATKNPNLAGWFARNNAARDAFIARAEGGMNLSRRVWQYSKQLRDEMELAISVAAAEGKSAADLSRDVRKYLAEPDRLFRRVRQYYYDENGDKKYKLVLSKAAQACHPGRGVYRSSYKNAMRMARTETNMAYRSADFERWQALEFVKGFHIGLSKAHPHADICDLLTGDYPKEFKFTGWHPQCFCVVTPITSSDEDFAKQLRAKLAGDPMPATTGKITAMPAAFNEWIKDHEEQIKAAPSLPYWIRDNFIDGDIKKGLRFQQEPTLLQLAEARHAARTPEQIKAIKDRWEARVKANAENLAKYEAFSADAGMQEYLDYADAGEWKLAELRAEIEEARKRYELQLAADKIGDYEAKAKAIAAQDAYLEVVIPDAAKWRKRFTYDELEGVYKAVGDHVLDWESAYGTNYAGILKKAETERDYFLLDWKGSHSKYKTWEASVAAYDRYIAEIKLKIEWQAIDTSADSVKTFIAAGTKSTILKNLYAQYLALDKSNAANIPIAKDILQQAADKITKLGKKSTKEIDFKPLTKKQRGELIKQYKKETALKSDERNRPQTESAWTLFDDNEKLVLTKYTQTYNYLNERLRNLPYKGLRTPQEYQDDLPRLTKALSSVKAPKNMIVRRGTNDFPIAALGKNLSDLEAGDVWVDGAFLSTSVHRDYGFFYDYNLVILVPKGAQGVYAEPFTHFNGDRYDWQTNYLWNGKDRASLGVEREWIGQRGSKFRVLARHGHTIYMEMIGQLYSQ